MLVDLVDASRLSLGNGNSQTGTVPPSSPTPIPRIIRPVSIMPKSTAPAQRPAPIVYSTRETTIAMRRPTASLRGPKIKAPPTAPSGTPELTRLTCLTLRPRAINGQVLVLPMSEEFEDLHNGMNKFAPDIKLWSIPLSKPPIEAKPVIVHQ